MADTSEVRAFILAYVDDHPRGIAKLVAERFSISRQAANRHVARLVEEGLLLAQGETRGRSYRLAVLGGLAKTIPITADLEEHALWEEHVLPLLRSTPANVRDICNYGFTEMVNNAKDHSGSSTVSITARMRRTNDFLVEATKPVAGTAIEMRIGTSSEHTTMEVFDRYATDQDDYAFQRTHVVVSLAQSEGEKLVSRSQAKRIVARLDRFKEVMLDFKGIDSIGPAFADEIFRVFRSTHPAVHLRVVNASDEVQKMIRRAESAAAG